MSAQTDTVHITAPFRLAQAKTRFPATLQETLTARLGFAAIAILLACFVSGQLLIHLGWSYILGSFPEKVHPSTYLATAFLGYLCCTRTGAGRINTVIRQSPATIFMIVSVMLLTVYAGVVIGVPASGLPDTWILASEFFILCSILNNRERRIMRIALDVFMIINSLVGLFEIVTNIQIVPLTIASAILGAYVYPVEWRAGAFLGHPLGNAYVTASYILLVILDRRIPPLLLRLPILGLHAISLVAFGSRGAMGFLAGFVVLIFTWQFVKMFITGKVSRDYLAYLGIGGPAVALALPVVLASGLADRFIQRIEVDHGSASARTAALDMMGSFTWSELIFGPPTSILTALGERYGIGSGIENLWLALIFNYGLIGFFILIPVVFLLCRDVVRRTGPYTITVFLFFFACCTTSVSLASKSLTFAILVALCLTSRHIRPTAWSSSEDGRHRKAADTDDASALGTPS